MSITAGIHTSQQKQVTSNEDAIIKKVTRNLNSSWKKEPKETVKSATVKQNSNLGRYAN